MWAVHCLVIPTSLCRKQHHSQPLGSSRLFRTWRRSPHRQEFLYQIAGEGKGHCWDWKTNVQTGIYVAHVARVIMRTTKTLQMLRPGLHTAYVELCVYMHACKHALTGQHCFTKALSVLTFAFFKGETLEPIQVRNANFALLLISSPVSNRT